MLIQPGKMKVAQQIREYIATYKSTARNNRQAPPSANGSLDDLRQLAELRDSGIITAEEFEAKKRQILAL